MDSEHFVRALKIAAERSSVKGMKGLLIKPPGRKPNAELLRRSECFNFLSEEDKNMVMEIAGEAVKSSVLVSCVY